jgi:hypothetical protein
MYARYRVASALGYQMICTVVSRTVGCWVRASSFLSTSCLPISIQPTIISQYTTPSTCTYIPKILQLSHANPQSRDPNKATSPRSYRTKPPIPVASPPLHLPQHILNHPPSGIPHPWITFASSNEKSSTPSILANKREKLGYELN